MENYRKTQLIGRFTDMDIDKLQYVGWIPTVSGRLSYRHIGDTLHPGPSNYANLYLVKGRVIIVYQKRDLSDSYIKALLRAFFGITGNFHFILIGQHEDTDHPISGKVFIFKSDKDWNDGSSFVIKSVLQDLNELQKADNYQNVLSSEIGALILEATSSCEKKSDIQIGFELHRNGEIYFHFPVFKSEEMVKSSNSYAHLYGYDFQKWLIDQAYFFIRDISHEHQHHSNDVDTIIITQILDDNNYEWRKSILYSLYYFMIKQKRNQKLDLLLQSKGILAYAKSFEAISKRHGKMPDFQSAALESSLNTKIDELKHCQMQSNFTKTYIASIRAAIIATLAIFVAIFSDKIKLEIDKNLYYQMLKKYFTLMNIDIFSAVFFILILVWVYTLIPSSPFKTFLNIIKIRIGVLRILSILGFLIATASIYYIHTLTE